jgi:hypothetical protein
MAAAGKLDDSRVEGLLSDEMDRKQTMASRLNCFGETGLKGRPGAPFGANQNE